MGTGSTSLLDYRRRAAQLYADVREASRLSGPEVGHRIWRTGRDRLFAGHAQSPLLPGDARRSTGLPVAPYDPDLRWTLDVEPSDPDDASGRLDVATGTDGTVGYQRLGRVLTPFGPLDVWWLTGYGGGVWLPVRDGSCGAQGAGASYGGGRYLLDTVKGADLGGAGGGAGGGGGGGGEGAGERLVVDLNFLYNPSCAYDPAWACPLAPPGNRLDVVLAAGELAG